MNTSIKCNEIDYVRYIGIFLVILGHMHYTINNVFIKDFIYLFHMPLFFLISGMLAQKNLGYETKRETKKKLFNSVLGLCFIYIIYNLPYCTSKENIIKIFTFNWMPNIATWFYITMACVKILCHAINKCKSIILLITSMILITCMHYAFPNNSNYLLKSVCMAIPFYTIGYLYSFFLSHVYYKKNSKKIYTIGFVLLLVIFLLFLAKYIGRVDMYTGTYKYSIITYIMIALTGCCIPFGLAKCLTMQHDFIYYTSRCTGFIVGTHMICNLLTKLHLNNILLYGIVWSVIIILAYYPVCKIVYTRFPFLIGKIKLIK